MDIGMLGDGLWRPHVPQRWPCLAPSIICFGSYSLISVRSRVQLLQFLLKTRRIFPVIYTKCLSLSLANKLLSSFSMFGWGTFSGLKTLYDAGGLGGNGTTCCRLYAWPEVAGGSSLSVCQPLSVDIWCMCFALYSYQSCLLPSTYRTRPRAPVVAKQQVGSDEYYFSFGAMSCCFALCTLVTAVSLTPIHLLLIYCSCIFLNGRMFACLGLRLLPGVQCCIVV